MAIVHCNIKSILFLLFFSLIFTTSAFGGTYFVDMAGSDSNGNGSRIAPWKTVSHALENVKSRDIISINDGTYSEGRLVVPAGVSLTSTSSDNTKVHIQPNTSLSASRPFILLSSTSPGSSGNQTISHLEIDGINGGNIARSGIQIKNRNAVRIHHCNIHDFRGQYGSYGVESLSTQIAKTNQNHLYWPADPQAPGTDTNINALWPANPVQNFELDNNRITDCGYRESLTTGYDHLTAAVQIFNLKDSSIHHNYIDCTNSYGEPIWQCSAIIWNVDIYSNTLIMGRYTDRGSFTIELWNMRGGCEFYDNTANAGFSITVGKETIVRDNTIIFDPPEFNNGHIGVEFVLQSHSEIYGNYIEGAESYGIDVGVGGNGKNWIVEHVSVHNNVFYNTKLYAIGIFGRGPKLGPQYTNTARHINVYNNVIDGQTSAERGDNYHRTRLGIHVSQDNYTGKGLLNHVNIKNNIIQDVTGSAGTVHGTVSNLAINTNRFYNNTTNDFVNGNATNSTFTDPTHSNPGNNYAGYSLLPNSDCIESGVDVGLPYEGSAPNIGLTEKGAPPPGGKAPIQPTNLMLNIVRN